MLCIAYSLQNTDRQCENEAIDDRYYCADHVRLCIAQNRKFKPLACRSAQKVDTFIDAQVDLNLLPNFKLLALMHSARTHLQNIETCLNARRDFERACFFHHPDAETERKEWALIDKLIASKSALNSIIHDAHVTYTENSHPKTISEVDIDIHLPADIHFTTSINPEVANHWIESIIEDKFQTHTIRTDNKMAKQLLQSGDLEVIRQHKSWPRFVEWLKFLTYLGHRFRCYYYIATLPVEAWGYLQCFTLGLQSDPEVTSHVQMVLDQAPLCDIPLILYRVIFKRNATKSYILPGRQYPISTTADPNVAIYLGRHDSDIYSVKVNVGQKALFLGPLSQFFRQDEVLLDRNEIHRSDLVVDRGLIATLQFDQMMGDVIFEKIGGDDPIRTAPMPTLTELLATIDEREARERAIDWELANYDDE